MINKIESLVKSIYLNYAINFFSLNILVILLYLFDFNKFVNETALLASFVILICQMFSGNSRTLVLANKNFINANDVMILRILFLFPITIFSFLFVYIYNFSDISFATSIICLILSQWVYEICLSKNELKSKNIIFHHFVLSFVIFLFVLIALYLKSIFFLKIIIFTYSMVIFYYSISYLFQTKTNIPKMYIDIKSLFNILVFSSYGSSLSIAVSNFFFRYFLIALVSEDIASTLIICFMAGSFPVSLFTQIIGASLFRFKLNFRKLFRFFTIIFIFTIALVIFLINDLFFEINYRVFELNEIIKFTICISLVGIYPMMLGLFRRQFHLNNSTRRENFFYLDIVYSFSVILVVPFLYIVSNPNYFSFGFLVTGCLSFFIFNFSKMLDNKKIINFFLFLIPFPIFFSIFDGLKTFNFSLVDETIISENILNLSVLPLPISSFVIPLLLISLLSNTKNSSNTIYFVSLSFFMALFSLSFSNRFNFSNFLNLAQFYLPLIAIICGEIVGENQILNKKFLKYFFITASFIMIFQIIFTIFHETNYLNPDIYFLYIYQAEQYSSLALILIFFIFIYKIILKNNKNTLNFKIYLSTFVLILYIYFSQNLLYYFYALAYILFLLAFTKKYILTYIILILVIILFLSFSEHELFFDINIFLDYRISWYQLYFSEIIKTPESFLLGSNINNELYKNLPGIFNYYLDFIYNFGFLSIIPLLILIFLTLKKTYNLRKFFYNNHTNLGLFFVFLLILFVDSFLKVSLKQPYIAIIVFFTWGVYYSHLKKLDR